MERASFYVRAKLAQNLITIVSRNRGDMLGDFPEVQASG
jgi:hypothetical protein